MSLSSMDGVGPSTIDKLSKVGVENLSDLATKEVEDLTDAGIFENKAERLIQRAQEEAIILQSGDEVAEEQSDKNYVSTGMPAFNDMLGGGWEPGYVAAIYGPTSTGKTQICFQSMVSAVEETGDPAIYIETERDRYRPDRLRKLANEDDTQSKIFRIKAYDLDQQKRAYDKVTKLPKQKDSIDSLSMVVIDSFTARFRLSDKFEDRGSLQARSKEMARHLTKLENMAERLGVPILMTAQVYGNPSGYGSADNIYGGSLMQHTVGCFVRMKNAQQSLNEAQLRGHPGQKDDEVYIAMSDSVIEAQKNV